MRALKLLHSRHHDTRARVRAEIAALLTPDPTASGLTAADLTAAACCAHAAIDAEGQRALASSTGPVPACAAGCSHCCHVHADATVPELLAIAEHLRSTWSPPALADLRARLAAHVARVAPLDDDARWTARIPCALLDDAGRCTIHEVRPLRCRAFHSASATPCRDAFAGDPDAEPLLNPALDRAHDAVEDGYDQALAEAGLPPEGHHLEAGLLLALDTPDAGARWLSGDAVFTPARR
ncbi:YkgJ family cysteine cluster protein [Chondromyces apiculatus]|uniref:YkgJ family cysteine cluster protein n=1 Tax=Chondromyces apiculatus TaxID=51 RepID=UPI0006935202|nr:YkgJ family cysteine cluster protein [Chondromyces apiculatus]